MRTIYKYQLPFLEEFTMTMPKDAEIIRCGGQEGFLLLWAVIDTEAVRETRTFYLRKTGSPLPLNLKLKYIGCAAIFVQQELMMYIFEEEKDD